MHHRVWWGVVFRRLTTCTVVTGGLLAGTLGASSALAFTLNVVDQNGAAVTVGYRYLVEEDTTQHPVPGVSTTNILAFQFHKSWMPPVMAGTDADGSLAKWTPDPAKNYIISVVPNFTQD